MRVSPKQMKKLLAQTTWQTFSWANGPWYRDKQWGSGTKHSEPVGRRKTRWLPCLMRALAAEERKRRAPRGMKIK